MVIISSIIIQQVYEKKISCDDVVSYFKGLFNPTESELRPEHYKLSSTLKSVFDKIDTNKDGQLETEELKIHQVKHLGAHF